MRFYDFNAGAMKRPQDPDVGAWLRPDGSNLASVVARLGNEKPEALRRVTQYLSAIVPGVISVERAPLGPLETLGFMQRNSDSSNPQPFYASSMSMVLCALALWLQFLNP